MKKVNRLLYLFLINGLSFTASYIPTQLTKVFYHQGMLGDKVVCYFDKTPLCNTLPNLQEEIAPGSAHKKVEFFLPMAILANNDARKMMQKLNDTKREHYRVKMSEEEKPVKGIKISIEYNPQYIVCDYATCDSISNQKSLAFSFHNKKALEAVQLHNGSILRNAHHNILKSKPHIMLDFGHGGEDAGKIGYYMIKEKDINLQVGNKLAHLLKKKGYHVSLTRDTDVFVALDERTTKANTMKVDLFLSLHANGCSTPTVSGIETYWSARAPLAWKQVGTTSNSVQKIVATLQQKLDTSSLSFAQAIHENVIKTVSKNHPVNNRNVKQSVAQVLFGTDVPSALIEMGFLTNQAETSCLSNPSYQQLLAQGIVEGIEGYLEKNKIL
jgi:N-acetylmuramoyl-L-alanine amidase